MASSTPRRGSFRDFLVYLAGPVTGLTCGHSQSWREDATGYPPEEIRGMSPLRGLDSFLEGRGILADSYQDNPRTTDAGIVTQCKFDVMRADALLVNLLGADRISVGTVTEVAWAYLLNKPIVLVMEDSGNPHEHSFIRQQAGYRVNNLDAGLDLIVETLMPEGFGRMRGE